VALVSFIILNNLDGAILLSTDVKASNKPLFLLSFNCAMTTFLSVFLILTSRLPSILFIAVRSTSVYIGSTIPGLLAIMFLCIASTIRLWFSLRLWFKVCAAFSLICLIVDSGKNGWMLFWPFHPLSTRSATFSISCNSSGIAANPSRISVNSVNESLFTLRSVLNVIIFLFMSSPKTNPRDKKRFLSKSDNQVLPSSLHFPLDDNNS